MKLINCIVLAILIALLGCKSDTDLVALAQRELKSGVINDSLFLGLRFGMERKEFFDHCWKINRQGIVTHGTENMSVMYVFEDGSNKKIAFNFYPEFQNNKTNKYKCSFGYYAWAPWNKDLQSDDLIKVLPTILERWYGGNSFIKVKGSKGIHYYKIDGNRQIDLHIKDDRLIAAYFTDLTKYPLNFDI